MPKDAFRHEVALRLKEARREHTLTQRQLADLGLSTQQNISRYEKGFIPDSWFLLARLHSEKAIDLNWLLGAAAAAAQVAGNGGPAAGMSSSDGRIAPTPSEDGKPAAAPVAGLSAEPPPVATWAPAASPEPTLLADDLERGDRL